MIFLPNEMMKTMRINIIIPRGTASQLCPQPSMDDELSEQRHFSPEYLLVRFQLILHLLSALNRQQPYLISHKLQF